MRKAQLAVQCNGLHARVHTHTRALAHTHAHTSIVGLTTNARVCSQLQWCAQAVVVRRARRNVELSPMSAVVIGQVALGDVVVV